MPLTAGSAIARTGLAGAMADALDVAVGRQRNQLSRAKSLDAMALAIADEVNDNVGSAVESVNGQTGVVVLDAPDVGADPAGEAAAALAAAAVYTDGEVAAEATARANADAAHVAAPDPHNQYALADSLGDAASLNVGTAPGTVAAGDQAAGGDASGTLAALTVVKARGLRETSGPTTLTMGAVADGQLLKRVGSTVVGAWIALAYATAPMAEIDAPGAQMGGYTTGGGTVA